MNNKIKKSNSRAHQHKTSESTLVKILRSEHVALACDTFSATLDNYFSVNILNPLKTQCPLWFQSE